MSNVPLPLPGSLGLIQYAGVDMHAYAAAVSAADNAALREQLTLAESVRAAQVAGLVEGVEKLEQDAARYRWLRDPHNQDCHSVGKCAPDVETYEAIDWLYDDALDESIDAARLSLIA
jgi:hypothetical protein